MFITCDYYMLLREQIEAIGDSRILVQPRGAPSTEIIVITPTVWLHIKLWVVSIQYDVTRIQDGASVMIGKACLL